MPMSNFILLILLFCQISQSTEHIVKGNNFEILATQEIEFVPLQKYDESLFQKNSISPTLNFRSEQSSVKSQGQRGSCTYFVMSGLLESLIIQKQKTEIDISEEYIAWAGKVKNKLRTEEEDSSVAVNASTVQKFGIMLEKDLPYQPSWFNPEMPCESQKGQKNIDPICYSHKGPSSKNRDKIIKGSDFIFESVDSKSSDVVLTMDRLKSPVTASIKGHPLMWESSRKTGELILTTEHKKECIAKTVRCSSHAVLIVGYDLGKKIFHFKNSWGTQWGDQGYGTISFDYMDQLSARKFMTGRLVKKINLE